MRLRFFIALLAIAVIVCSCTTEKTTPQTVSDIYTELLMTEDTDQARRMLKPLAESYEKTFLMACIELSDGNLKEAKRHAQRLLDMEPDIIDGKVLLAIIKRRSSNPEELWLNSFAAAWKKQGYKELTIAQRLADMIDLNGWYSDKLEIFKGKPDELLIKFRAGLINSPDKTLESFLKYSKSDMPTEIRIFALSTIDPSNQYELDELSQDAKSRRSHLIHQLAEEYPSVMIYDLMILMEETSNKEIFDEPDIAELEKISRKTKLSHTGLELYSMYKKRYKDIGFSYPRCSVFTAIDAYRVYPTHELTKKAVATAEGAPASVKLRLSRIIENIGKAHLKQNTLIDLFIGYYQISRAAKMKGDHKMQEDAEEIRLFFAKLSSEFYNVYSTAMWPIHPLNEEAHDKSLENEIKYFMLVTNTPMPEELKKYLE